MVATDRAAAGQLIGSADQRVLMHSVPWSHYEVMLALRGEASLPRIAYLKGELELMSPSLEHERIKAALGRLVDYAAELCGVELWPVGSWTIRSAQDQRGLEPDECFTRGDPRGHDVPDLAVEVVWTSGGIDKLEIYCGLGVGEVWFWQHDSITVHVLADGRYEQRAQSGVLPGLDPGIFVDLVEVSPSEARKALRERLG